MIKNALSYTNEQRQEICKDFLTSGLSKRAYCDQQKICNKTLNRWLAEFNNILPSHNIKGTSTLYDAEGNQVLQWVKTDKAKESIKEALKGFVEGIKDDIPIAPIVRPPDISRDNLLTCYILTDAHIGMRSDEWNLDIAEQTIKAWIDEAIKQAPAAHTGVFCLQGDIAHFDSLSPVTPASGHVLDADGNARAMNRLIIKLVRYCIRRLLAKHSHVHIIYACGNHDEYTAIIQSEWLDIHYSEEPRITVDITDSIYHAYEWGNTSLFFHHGHKRKISDIATVFAGLFRDMFGRTTKSYGHIGHYHHSASKENQLMKVEIHPTLSGKDDYAKHGGWLSMRAANVITYHKQYGEVGRITICPEMLL